jgi:hypothetical protein
MKGKFDDYRASVTLFMRLSLTIASLALLFLGIGARPASAFDTWWHAEATRHAMKANGFSDDARLATQVSNYLTDFYPVLAMGIDKVGAERLGLEKDVSFDYLHFDDLPKAADVERQWGLLEKNTRAALRKYAADANVKPGFRLIVLLNIIGSSLHAVQDFYSHSNWVELHGNRGTIPIPVWFDVPAAERAKLVALRTGAYPDHTPPQMTDHATMNHDTSQRPRHSLAFDAARRAAIDWVRRLMTETGVPWDELKAYHIKDNMVMRRFLYDLDATFLTSTSILAGHLDGKTPAKSIFNNDPTKEKAQALQAALLVMNGYATNIALEGNTFKLPSPYWSGYKVYHVSYDLAEGMKLGNSTFRRPPP